MKDLINNSNDKYASSFPPLNKITVLDGGMGTMLLAAGMKAGEHPEIFAYHNPGIVEGVHRKYIAAGSNVIYSCTFGANSRKLQG